MASTPKVRGCLGLGISTADAVKIGKRADALNLESVEESYAMAMEDMLAKMVQRRDAIAKALADAQAIEQESAKKPVTPQLPPAAIQAAKQPQGTTSEKASEAQQSQAQRSPQGAAATTDKPAADSGVAATGEAEVANPTNTDVAPDGWNEAAISVAAQWDKSDRGQKSYLAEKAGMGKRVYGKDKKTLTSFSWDEMPPDAQRTMVLARLNKTDVNPVAPSKPKKKPAGARNLRKGAYEKNPLLTFLATHGLYHEKDKPNSMKSEFSPDKTIMIAGYGPIFKRTGKDYSSLVPMAIEDGYLPQGGTASELYDLIHRAVGGEKIVPMYAEGVADQVIEQAFADHLAQQQEAAQDEDYDPFDFADELGFTEDDADIAGYDEALDPIKLEVNALLAKAQELGIDTDALKEDVYYATADQSEQDNFEYLREAANRAIKEAIERSNRDSSANAGSQGNAGDEEGVRVPTEEEALAALESYTPADVLATQARAEQATKAELKSDQDAEAKAKAKRIAKEIQQRQDASAENFQLGQSAEESLSGQGSIFDAPESVAKPVSPPEDGIQTKETDRGVAMFSLEQTSQSDRTLAVNEANREKTNRLQKAIKKQGHDFTITPVALPVNVADDAGERASGISPKNSFGMAERIASIFGKEVVWFTATGPFDINGVVVPGGLLSKQVFINANADHPAHVVLGHELTHHMEKDAPGAYEALVKSINGLLRNHDKYRQKYGIEAASDDFVVKEMIGDLVGDNFDKREFWNLVAKESNGTYFRMIANSISKWLTALLTKFKHHGLGSHQFVTDVQEARAILAKAVADYAKNNATSLPDSGGAVFSRSTVSSYAMHATDKLNEALKEVTVTDLKNKFGNRLSDFRGLALQTLGRRQLVDIYAKDIPMLEDYNRMVAQMDADKNEAGADADKLVTDWGNIKDARQLAELMHDATLAKIDPSKPYIKGDDENHYEALKDGWEKLSPEAKATYIKARDMYATHHDKVRAAIRERIERSALSTAKRQALLEKMDGEFFKQVSGVYFPLSRFGQYLTIVRDSTGEVLNVSRSETLNEAEATRKILKKDYPASGGFQVGKVLKQREFNAVRDGVGRGFMEDLFQTLEKTGASEELQDSISQLYLASLPDLSWAKHGIHRKGTPGFSQDARRAFAQNMFHGGSYLAKLRYADKLQSSLDDMQENVDNQTDNEGYDSVKAQQVVDEMVKRHETMMNPKSNPISTALTSFGFVFHLGLSPASALVNLSQTALVAYPIMGAKWGFSKSSAALLTASKQAASNKNDISKVLQGDELKAYNEAVRSGTIDVTMAHDLAGISQGEDANMSAKLRPVMKWASFMFHHAEKFNRQVTFVASYRLAREAGQGHDAAYADAVKATYDGHFDYSASNRARFMQGNWQKVFLLFKQYAQNMIYTLGRNLQQAIQAETPERRKEARKAITGLLVSHAMAAGAFGLPMVGMMLSLASAIGGDDDEPWDAKVALQNMLADTFGQKPAEVFAHGLSRLTPWDISGRVGLDKLLLPDIQEGLEGTSAANALLASAAGPVAGILVNAMKGLSEISGGDYKRGLESMMPAALRGPLKAYRYGSEGNVDKSGKVLNDEVSFAGVAGQVLGLSPSETRLAQEGKSAIYAAERAIQERRSTLVRQFAQAAMVSDEEGKTDVRKDIARFNEKNPASRITPSQLARSVKERRKRIADAKQGVYLPKKRQGALEAGRFALVD